MDQQPESRPHAPPPPALLDAPEDGTPIPYDPADYRWVPVRRRPRLDGWTEEKQRRFIEVLADTGVVSHAAKAVGMSRESANKLRRAPHAAAFARAWDAARHHAGNALEDIAFERAIEGVEQNVFDEHGNVITTKRVYNDRLLTFLLRHLKPERYARDALATPAPAPATVEASLTAMEPCLPAPAEQLLGPDTLADELELAEVSDGELPGFLSERRPAKSDARLAAERTARGQAANEKMNRGETLDDAEFGDLCFYLDPAGAADKGRRRYR